MTTLKQYKHTRIQTPVGEAIYPHLNKPDTKYNVDGHFKVKMKIPLSQELTDLMATIEAENETQYQLAVAEAKAQNKRPPKKAEINFFEQDGFGMLSLKCNATIKNRETGEVTAKTFPILDANGAKYETIRYVNSGSVIQSVIDLVPMNSAITGAGVSLRLICVKVHKFASLPPRETTEAAAVAVPVAQPIADDEVPF